MLDTLASLLQRLAGSRPSDLPDDPGLANVLPPCPGSPNCVRVSRRFAVPSARLRSALLETLRRTGARDIRENKGTGLGDIRAVYRAGIFFDEVQVQVEAETGPSKTETPSSVLHLRSASRVGHVDLGVNRRRVRRILRGLEKLLGKTSG